MICWLHSIVVVFSWNNVKMQKVTMVRTASMLLIHKVTMLPNHKVTMTGEASPAPSWPVIGPTIRAGSWSTRIQSWTLVLLVPQGCFAFHSLFMGEGGKQSDHHLILIYNSNSSCNMIYVHIKVITITMAITTISYFAILCEVPQHWSEINIFPLNLKKHNRMRQLL